MNKKKLGVSLGFVSLLALGLVGVNKDNVIDLVKDTSESYVESISTYKDENLNKNKIKDEKDIQIKDIDTDSKNIEVAKGSSKDNSTGTLDTLKFSLNDVSYQIKEDAKTENNTKAVEVEQPTAKDENITTEPTTVDENKEGNVVLSGEIANTEATEPTEVVSEVAATEPTTAEEEVELNIIPPKVEGENELQDDGNHKEGVPQIETNDAKIVELPVEGWISSNLNVRSSKKVEDDNIIGFLEVGTKISGIESNGWVKIDFENKTGYISRDYLSNSEIKPVIKEEPVVENNITGWVKVDLNLREAAKKDGKVLTVIPKGTKVTGTESNGWVYVTHNNINGYISNEYVSDTEIKVEQEVITKPEETNNNVSPGNGSSKIDNIVNSAMGLLGKPYIFGAAGPDAFDCSGLVYYLYQTHAGVTLNRIAADQAANGYDVSWSNLAPGDLVFFATAGGNGISHVGIYVGGGQMVHASTPDTGVIIDNITNSEYYQNTFVCARRII